VVNFHVYRIDMKIENSLWDQRTRPAARRFVEALGGRELERAVSCFGRDGCLITPDQTAVHGREQIRPVLSQMIQRRTAIVVEESVVLSAGDIALASERWTIRCDAAGGERFAFTSTPRLVLRRRGIEWKLEIAALWGWS
jgi:ketosteroid isomerase-like protein